MTSGLPAGDQRRLLLKAAAYILGYPDGDLDTLLDEMRPDLEQLSEATAPAAQLMAVITALRAKPPDMRTASYVATFDFNEARTLYLTAHELGDSRRRGQALLDLQAMLRTAGFEPPKCELPDYLPLLLEFVCSAPPDTDTSALEQRLALVCAQIYVGLAAEDPYRMLFAALCALLPAVEPEGSGAAASQAQAARAPGRPRFPLHERADTAELPYPLHYE